MGIRFQTKVETKPRRSNRVGWMLFVLCVAPPCFEQVQAQGSSDTSALAAAGPAPAPDANATSSQQALVPLDSADASPIAPTPIAPAPAATAAFAGFWSRFAKAYYDDWHADPNGGEPMPYRGFPPPEENPPYPFSVWPLGGTVWIGYPNATAYPLWTALSTSPHGDWWKKANIQIYGWADAGLNFSTSNESTGGKYANAPAAYNQVSNSIQLDQLVTYIERVPDTIQTSSY